VANEGWATYCETIFREFVKSKENALNFRRSAHEQVLRVYHHKDGGFHPLYPISQDITYSSTVYQKGASVAHALRGYLGDSVFFTTIKEYLRQNAYTSNLHTIYAISLQIIQVLTLLTFFKIGFLHQALYTTL